MAEKLPFCAGDCTWIAPTGADISMSCDLALWKQWLGPKSCKGYHGSMHMLQLEAMAQEITKLVAKLGICGNMGVLRRQIMEPYTKDAEELWGEGKDEFKMATFQRLHYLQNEFTKLALDRLNLPDFRLCFRKDIPGPSLPKLLLQGFLNMVYPRSKNGTSVLTDTKKFIAVSRAYKKQQVLVRGEKKHLSDLDYLS